MPRGRWKQDRGRREEFFRKALATTQVPMKFIAEVAGVDSRNIYKFNKYHRIRDAETTREIGARARSKLGPKKFHFTEERKSQIIREFPYFNSRVGIIWKDWAGTFRKAGITFDDLVADIKKGAWERLDYYDPHHPSKSSLNTFLNSVCDGYLRIRLLHAIDKIKREKKIALGKTRRSHKKPRHGKIPTSGRRLLKKLGANLEQIVELPYGEVKDKTIEIARQAGLTKKQVRLIELRLEGKTLQECSVIFGFMKHHGGARYLETQAVAKIKAYQARSARR